MTSSRSQLARSVAGAILAISVCVGFSACTQDESRLPPTIGGGVNAEVGGEENPVKVLNLMVITKDGTSGFLDGVVTSTGDDELLSVSSELIDVDNNPTGVIVPFEGGPAPVTTNVITRLSVGAPYTITGELPIGLTLRTTLVFASAGEVTLDVPIVDGNNADYATVTPQPSVTAAAASASTSPSASPSPTP